MVGRENLCTKSVSSSRLAKCSSHATTPATAAGAHGAAPAPAPNTAAGRSAYSATMASGPAYSMRNTVR